MQRYPRISPASLALFQQVFKHTATYLHWPATEPIWQTACPAPDQASSFQANQTLVKAAVHSLSLAQRDDLCHRMLTIKNQYRATPTDVIEVAGKIVL